MDDLMKIINRPTDYVTFDDLTQKLQNYATKDDVEIMILQQKIDTKASKQQVIDL